MAKKEDKDKEKKKEKNWGDSRLEQIEKNKKKV